MDNNTINRILQNLPPDVRRRTHEAFDEARRMDAHFEQEVLSEDPEMGLERIYRGTTKPTKNFFYDAHNHDMHEPDDLPFSDVDPEEMMLREMGVYDD